MAQPPTSATLTPPDAAALARTLARLARAESAPWLHHEVARRMASRLTVIKLQPAAWLEWSAHLGGGAELLRQTYPKAQRMVAEPTESLAGRSRAAAARPWWGLGRRADPVLVGDMEPPIEPQLLWSNMALHLAPEVPQLLAAWQRQLAVGGFLMFSTFGPDTLAELRELHAQAGWGPPLQDLADMHDLGDALVAAGFADPVMDQETLRLSWSTPEAALAELRGLGGNAHPRRQAGLRTPRWRERLLRALAARGDAQGRITLRFEIVYGHAFRAAPRPRAGAPATVALQALRATLPSAGGRKSDS
jgi:malonyl-CoA O-methyltransferase